MSRPKCLSFFAAALLSLGLAGPSWAASRFQILVDLGNDGSSCPPISTVDGNFPADQVLTADVDTSGAPVIASWTLMTCSAGAFNPATAPPVPSIGSGGGNTESIATSLPLGGFAGTIRLGATGENLVTGTQDALLTVDGTPDGAQILVDAAAIIQVPTLGEWGLILLATFLSLAGCLLLRQRRQRAVVLGILLLVTGGAGLVWAASVVTAVDQPDDAPVNTEVESLSASVGANVLNLTLVVDLDTPPNAVNDSFSTNEDTTLNQPAPGLLANDTGTGLSVTPQVAAPTTQGGTVTVNGNGSFTYNPPADFFGADSFNYTVTSPSGTDSATATIAVQAVNDVPSFTKGPDQTVNEDAGPQTVNPWATGISTGPANESTQTVTFNVTGNTNAALFSAGPAVAADGTLTYTPAANANGTATITLVMQDSGGVANSGVDSTAPQSFDITVNAVNDPPSFTKGPDQTVNEDAGPQTVSPWATAISPGPADESGQTVAFNVTGNTNPGLFSAGPAVSPTGVLTYTPAADATGTATITLTLQDNGGGTDTSAPQSFVITVAGVNDPPSFVKGPDQTVNEDAGPQTVNPWATAISPGAGEGGQTVTFNITSNTNPALFSAGPAVSPTGVLTYTPATNANGTATITLVLQDNGGGGTDTSPPQSFVITVNAVNDPPSFTKGPDQTVNEDAGPQTVSPWATAISPGPPDESGQTVTFNVTGNTNPALFSAGPAVSPTGVLTYTPAANTSGTATITLTLQDNGGGTDTSAPQSFVITVANVNDPPSFTKGPDQTVNEDAGPQTVNPWATAISPGPPDESGQTVTFNVTGNTNPALFSAGPAVSPTGVLTYTPAANAFGTATITLTLQDNGGGTDTSAPQSFVITVNAVNDPPSFTKGPDQTVNEDAGPQTVNPWATAISPGPGEGGQTVTFNVTGNTNPALFSAGPAVSPTGVLTYTPAADAFGTATITLTLQDNGGGGTDTSAPQSFVITVNAVNDPPSFTKGPDQTVNEDAGPQTVNPWATAISPGPSEGGQTVTFNITGNTNPGLFSAGPAVSPTGVLTYTPAANAFGTATITLTLQDNGGGTDTSAPQSFVITVNGVNDPPSFVKGPDQTVNEDAGPQTVNPWATAISPGPGEGGQTVTFNITGNTNPGLFSAGPAVSPTGVLTYTPAANAFGTATITLTLQDNGGGTDTSAPQSFVINVLSVNDAPVADNDSFDYIGNTELRVDRPTVATPHVPATTPSTFGLLDGDSDPVEGDAIKITSITFGTCTDSSGPSFDCTDPAIGTVHVQETGQFSFEPAPGDTGAAPTAGCTGTDQETFQYTLTDNGTPVPASTTAMVRLCRFQRVWYVDDAGAGNGTSLSPFNSFDSLDNAGGVGDSDVAGDYIFVHPGTPTVNAPIELENNEHLIGAGHVAVSSPSNFALSIPVGLNGNPSPTNLVATGAHPVLTNASGDTVRVTTQIPIEIVGLSLAGGTTAGGGSCGSPTFACNAIDLTSAAALTGSGTLTIANDIFRGAGAEGLDVNLNAGTVTPAGGLAVNVQNNSWDAAGTHTGNAVDVNRAAGTLRLDFSNNTSILSSATAVNIAGGAAANMFITGFANNTVHQNTAGNGMVVTNATFDANPAAAGYQMVVGGTTVIGASGVGNGVGGSSLALTTVSGDLAFTDLDVFADNGAGVQVTGTGAVNTGAGTGTRVTVGTGVAIFEATGGPAIDLNNLTADLQPTSIRSTNSASTGVSLVSVSDGTTAATISAGSGSSITNATGTDFVIDGGNATVSYAGTITDDVGQLVSVANTTADSKSFTGAITDGDDGDGSGVSLTNNTGATISFSGGLVLSTGGNAAFAATGGGTVAVCDENPCSPGVTGALVNKITTTTNTALNVANTTISANNLEFRSISAGTAASGPASGIVLNTTGSSGGLKVVGTGSAGSGGTIQKTTGSAVMLTSTQNVSLASMNISSPGDDGINGTSVNGLTLTGCSITNAGNSATDEGVELNNPTGTLTFTNTAVTGSAHNHVKIDANNVNLTAINVSGCTFSNNKTSGVGANGFLLSVRGTSTLGASTVSNTAFSDTVVSQLKVDAGDTATVTSFTAQNSTFTGISGNAVDFTQAQSANATYRLLNNATITGHQSQAINVFSSSATTGGTLMARIQGNTIGNAGVAGSGSATGSGVRVLIQGKTAGTVLVDGNVIRQVPQARGIDVQFLGPTTPGMVVPVSDVTVTNNDVNPQDSTGFPVSAIYVAADSQGGSTVTVRSDVRGNTVPAGAAFDVLPTYLAVDEVVAAAVCQLVDTPPASANATAQLTSTNTGSASAAAGCALIAGPINTPP